MRKLFLISLMVFMLLGVSTFESSFTVEKRGCWGKAFAANSATFNYSFTIISDTGNPYIANLLPANGAVDVPRNTDISFDILDDETGIDGTTLIIVVNGITRNDALITDIPNGKRVLLQNNLFNYGKAVEIIITVSDNAN